HDASDARYRRRGNARIAHQVRRWRKHSAQGADALQRRRRERGGHNQVDVIPEAAERVDPWRAQQQHGTRRDRSLQRLPPFGEWLAIPLMSAVDPILAIARQVLFQRSATGDASAMSL